MEFPIAHPVLFPLYSIVDGKCGCGNPSCQRIGKHPKVRWAELTNEDPLEPADDGAGYGMKTGAAPKGSGVIVVDLDGYSAQDDWKQLGGSIDDTFTVQTGRPGGLQLWYLHPGFPVKNSVGTLAEGIDIRGDGGMVVAPESPHKSGKRYEIVCDLPPAKIPEFLLKWQGLRTIAPRSSGKTHADDVSGDMLRYHSERYAEYLQSAPPSIQGENGEGALWDVVQYGAYDLRLPDEVCLELIAEHFDPRCEPPWGDELEERVLHKAHDAKTKSTRPRRLPTPEKIYNRLKTKEIRNLQMTNGYAFTPGQEGGVEGKPSSCNLNKATQLLLKGQWEGVLHFDDFRKAVIAKAPPTSLDAEKTKLTDADISAVIAWFNFNGYSVSAETATQAILLAAKKKTFHPVTDYIDSCTTSGATVLDTLATKVFGCDDENASIANDFLKKTLIGAVRRIRHPGCRMDTTLVLVGPQGLLKSTFVSVLFGEEFTRSQMPDLGSKDASQALLGFWAIELAEMDRIIRAETSTMKEFLTRTNDDYRASYGRLDQRYPRHVVFIGTTNEEDFLRDPTGNRRFWPIVCRKVDLDFVRANREAIWAEASALEAAGVPHWFDAQDEALAEAARESHTVEDPWHELIFRYIRRLEWVQSETVYDKAIAKDDEQLIARKSRREQMRVADTLKRLGCKPTRRNNRKGWEVPEAFRTQAQAEDEARLIKLKEDTKRRNGAQPS